MNLLKVVHCFLCVGLVFLIFGAFSYFVVPKIIESKITEQTRLINNSDTYWQWKSPDIPIFIRFYFFNVTNPLDVIDGQLPKFEEIGPFVYQERRFKEVDDIDTDNDTLTFRQSITYQFRSDLSAFNDDTYVTTLNIPLAAIAGKGRTMNGLMKMILTAIIHTYMDEHPGEVGVFVTRKVRELLFEGYYDGLLKELAETSGTATVPNNTFGLMVDKNATFGVPLTINAGVKDYTRFGQVVAVNQETKMKHWGNSFCNQINGSDGSLYPPFVTRDRIIRIFSDDACRSMHFTFQKDVDYFGLPVLRFHLPAELWASPENNPNNECFCAGQNRKCRKNGLMDVGVCKEGAPVLASMPHFLFGDPELWNLTGLSPPQVEKDETYLDIEPLTGLLFGAMKRFQVNVDFFKNRVVRVYQKVPTVVFPVLWGEEFFEPNKERANFLRNKLYQPLRLVRSIAWASFLVGALALLTASITLLLSRNQKQSKAEETKMVVFRTIELR